MKLFSFAYGIILICTCLQCVQAPPQNNTQTIPVYDLNELEQAIHHLVNQERARKQLSPLSLNPSLSKIARNHSEDMLANEYFSHNSLDGLTPSDRAQRAQFECTIISGGSQRTGIGENLLTTFSYHSYEVFESNSEESIRYNWKTLEELAEETVSTWMKSKGHRRNLLRSDYIQQGIGAVVGQEQKIFITQNFC